MPDDFLELLASDEDELTAYPALRCSPRLSVDLLLRVARSGPDSLRKAIANRPSLRESVISALCQHAGANVISILLDRDDVTLTQAQQTKLSCRSDIVATLGLVLAGQDALNPDGLMAQYLHLPAPLKAKAIAAAEMTSLLRQAQTPGGTAEHRPDSAHLRLQSALVEEAVAQNRTHFADLLAQGLGLPQSSCDLLLQADQSDGLTIALKALGMSASQTTTILIRLFGDSIPLNSLRNLLRLHGTLSFGSANVLVGQWMLQGQADQTTGAHKPAPQHAPQFQERRRREDMPGFPSEDRSARQGASHGQGRRVSGE
ncbi:DUF2336 domain-containing protein [Roseibium salinum]|uniref:DUF2336 domain-containing protein n=2 Tax=Roseibium salinum TaxID=1604349 RepID=A0ABT3QZJ0_9HYPH|nr:DUF2336 domain-containing protein [Roseibium sp. DSM 29163]